MHILLCYELPIFSLWNRLRRSARAWLSVTEYSAPSPLAVGYLENLPPRIILFVVLILCGDIIFARTVGLEGVATAPFCTTGRRAPRASTGPACPSVTKRYAHLSSQFITMRTPGTSIIIIWL